MVSTAVDTERSSKMRFTSPHTCLSCVAALALASCGADALSADELNAALGSMTSTPTSDSVASVTPPATTPIPNVEPTAPPTPTTTEETSTSTAAPTATPTATTTSPDTGAPPPAPTTSATTPETTTSVETTTTTAPVDTTTETTTEPETMEPIPEGPYAPRTGSFKMLVYSKTAGFRHAESITTGREMLTSIASQQGFEVKFTETNEEITVDGLSQYEIVFFLNSTGDIFSQQEQAAYEEWMTTHDGAFAGVHSATDTENGWGFYSEVTGQYYNGHTASPDTQGEIQWEAAQANHIAVKGLPNPWSRQEEWYKFNQSNQWSTKPGFVILSRITLNDDGGTRPVSYVREWNNFRSFYTSIGHAGRAFQDADVKKHVTAGIMWAVRREALIK